MKLRNVVIVVRDMERAKAFYKSLFGLQVVVERGGNAVLTEGLVLQEENVWKKCIGREVISENNATFLFFEEHNIEAFRQKLADYPEPVHYVNEYFEHPWGQIAIRFYDPDGNLIEVGNP